MSDHRPGLGLGQGTALYIAAVLGTGILVLPGLTATVAGPASILSVAIVLVLAIPLAGTFAALAARHPDPGGVASYARRALGATAGRATGYWFFFGVAAGFPVLAFLGGESLAAVLRLDPAVIPVVSFAILLPGFGVNLLGVRVAGWVQFALTGLLTAVVVFVVAVALPHTDTARFEPFLPHGWAGAAVAVSLFVWAFAGWEVGTHVSGEFRNPRRDIPLATAFALAVTGAAYLLLQIVTIGVLGADAGSGAAPLLDLVDAVAPGVGSVAVGVVAVIVVLGVTNAYLAAFGKLGASLAANGDLPRWFAPGAEAGGVPRRALLLTLAIGTAYFLIALVTGAGVAPFILVHTGCMASIYTAGMASALVILPRRSLGWWMALVALVLCVGLLAIAGLTLAVAVALAVAAIVVTLATRRRQGADVASSSPDAGEGTDASASVPSPAATTDASASAPGPAATTDAPASAPGPAATTDASASARSPR